jgi:hypothetical protein
MFSRDNFTTIPRISVFLVLILFFLISGAGFGFDFGASLSQFPKVEGEGLDADFSYELKLSPWASQVFQGAFSLYLGGSFSLKYENEKLRSIFISSNELVIIPELDRLEFAWRPIPRLYLSLGRISYEDPLDFVAKGFFDGAAAFFGMGDSLLSAGAYYTGFQYKETADMIVSQWDAADFADNTVYFAPSRILFTAGYEQGGLLLPSGTLSAAALAQFDLRQEQNSKLHSQYLEGKYSLAPVEGIDAALGIGFGLIEEERDGYYKGGINTAFSLYGGWTPSFSSFMDKFGMEILYASGLAKNNGSLREFVPLNSGSKAMVLDAELSGISLIRGMYSARILQNLSAEFQAAYFLRTDLTTFWVDRPNPNPPGGFDDYTLGLEMYASAVWTPWSDLHISAGGGFFLPQTGNAYDPEAPVKWNLSLGLVFSF